jgi:hypothetical protein
MLFRNATDPEMIEFYYETNNITLLACVMHENCISTMMINNETSLLRELDDKGTVEVTLAIN